jgi:bacteriocin-like protein
MKRSGKKFKKTIPDNMKELREEQLKNVVGGAKADPGANGIISPQVYITHFRHS